MRVNRTGYHLRPLSKETSDRGRKEPSRHQTSVLSCRCKAQSTNKEYSITPRSMRQATTLQSQRSKRTLRKKRDSQSMGNGLTVSKPGWPSAAISRSASIEEMKTGICETRKVFSGVASTIRTLLHSGRLSRTR